MGDALGNDCTFVMLVLYVPEILFEISRICPNEQKRQKDFALTNLELLVDCRRRIAELSISFQNIKQSNKDVSRLLQFPEYIISISGSYLFRHLSWQSRCDDNHLDFTRHS